MKKTKTVIGVAAFALAIGMSGCVTPLATATGNPEALVQKDLPSVKGELLAAMAAKGFEATGDSENTLAFTKPVDGGFGVLYQLAAGNAYSSPPRWQVRFTLVPIGKATHVYGFIGIAMQGAFGQDQGMNDTRGKAGHELQDILNQL